MSSHRQALHTANISQRRGSTVFACGAAVEKSPASKFDILCCIFLSHEHFTTEARGKYQPTYIFIIRSHGCSSSLRCLLMCVCVFVFLPDFYCSRHDAADGAGFHYYFSSCIAYSPFLSIRYGLGRLLPMIDITIRAIRGALAIVAALVLCALLCSQQAKLVGYLAACCETMQLRSLCVRVCECLELMGNRCACC